MGLRREISRAAQPEGASGSGPRLWDQPGGQRPVRSGRVSLSWSTGRGRPTASSLRIELTPGLASGTAMPKYLPTSQSGKSEMGSDVALAIDAMQVGLEGKIDIAVLVSGDGDFVP